ncbi:stage III sporulation protein AF [Bacillus massiliigorillae]|uniref:stage III sporulation protein AF n=1 Tax=Bacillus massiliigorillae TaxID=1243664 RepID=UPI0003A4F611|nr:stage III sporulation protein AF [Bacillus massiliigorillae]
MSFLTDWITNIIIFILLAIVMDMLLPSSSMQKYAKMVLGLLLIAILITPIFKFLSSNFEEVLAQVTDKDYVEKDKMESLIDKKKNEIQAANSAYILEEMAVQLKKTGEEELINRYNYEIKDINVSLKTLENPKLPKDLDSISVVLTQKEKSNTAIETVQTVRINTEEKLPIQNDETNDIRKFLGSQWGIDEGRINIVFERRGA